VDQNPGWEKLLDQYKIPMPSSYFNFQFDRSHGSEGAKWRKAIRLGKILKKNGGITAVIDPTA